MNHPDLELLTQWIHGFLEPDEASQVESHARGCGECLRRAEELRGEARMLSREISSPERLSRLKAGLLVAAAGPRSTRGLLWQVPVAAAVLLGLVALLLPGGPSHTLLEGRVALNDGRVVGAPQELTAREAWQIRALEKASLRLADLSRVELGPGTELSLATGGLRGVEPELRSGYAEFSVAPDSRRLSVVSPAGRVDAGDGKFSLRIVFEGEGGMPVKKTLAGAIVTVFAGTMSLSSAGGRAEAQAGQSAVLARAEAPLFLSAPQGQQEDLLRRLEQLAARVAKLEEEVTQLEEKNKQLKLQVAGNAPGAAWGILAPGQSAGGSGGVRIIQSTAGGAPGSPVIIELKEETEKPQKKPQTNPQTDPKER